MPDSPFRTLPPAPFREIRSRLPQSPSLRQSPFFNYPAALFHTQTEETHPAEKHPGPVPSPRRSSEHSSKTSPPQFPALSRTRPPYSAHRQEKHSQPEKRPGPVPSPRRSSEHTFPTPSAAAKSAARHKTRDPSFTVRVPPPLNNQTIMKLKSFRFSPKAVGYADAGKRPVPATGRTVSSAARDPSRKPFE